MLNLSKETKENIKQAIIWILALPLMFIFIWGMYGGFLILLNPICLILGVIAFFIIKLIYLGLYSVVDKIVDYL